MDVDVEKQPLITLPIASTALEADPVFIHPGGHAELRYEFEREGVLVRTGLRFERVRAFRFRSEGHCTAWHVQGAYDTLVEVQRSAWVAELLEAEPSETWGHWELHHFLLFLDSVGAFEVAAEAWSVLPESRAR